MQKRHYLSLLCTGIFLIGLAANSYAATVQGRVWRDQNNNGLQDAGETGLQFFTVRLLRADRSEVAVTLSTAPNGAYSFANVAAGTYIVHFAAAGGWWQTPQNQGTNDAVDNDADVYGFTAPFAVTAEQTVAVDAGFSLTPQGCFTPVTLTATNPVCNNNGTPANPADDTFTFSITATGGTGPWGFDLGALKMLPYGTPLARGPFPISGGPVTISINDHDNPACVTTIVVNPPAPCSTTPPPTEVKIVCPSPASVAAAPGATTAVVNYTTPTTTTTCATPGTTTVTLISGPASGSAFPVGTTEVCFRATDACGNSASCCFKVTVTPPPPSEVKIVCPSPASVAAAPGATTAVVNYTTPTATTTCATPGTTVTLISGPASGSAFPVGTTEVCFRATDACGNSASCCFKVTVTPPPPSEVKIVCPTPANVTAAAGATTAVVNYTTPTATTTCATPGTTVTRISGPASGSAFPVGTTEVCFRATDACGNSASCCFKVTVVPTPEPTPCDDQGIACVKFQLLTVTKDGNGDLVYRIRVINNCSPIAYLAFQLPKGLTAVAPANSSVYTAPSGRRYAVRNPGSSGFHSIRFTGRLGKDESDIFQYTLPKQVQPLFFLAMICLEDGTQYQVHLNTFACFVTPLMVSGANAAAGNLQTADVAQASLSRTNNPFEDAELLLFPNPTTGNLMVNLADWAGQTMQLQVISALGQLVQEKTVTADVAPISLDLDQGLSKGIYYLQAVPTQGERRVKRFVLSR
jgi:SdrD B-like domain/HYR domain/Secretion system C-terminal sorting domain